MNSKKYYDTYDEMSDSYANRYIDDGRTDFNHQWEIYTGDDEISYEHRDILKNLLGRDLFF